MVMPFPRPPRLRDLPVGPQLPTELRPEHPERATSVVIVSMVFWTIMSVGFAAIILWVIGPIFHVIRLSRLIVICVLIGAVWIGSSIGWRMGTMIIITAMRESKKAPSLDGPAQTP
jgi:hypothetical protein